MKAILLLVSLVFCCENPFKLVFTNGTQLAVQQESLFVAYQRGDTIDSKTLRDLKINWWVKSAEKTAPGNLVIRQYCLIDLYINEPDHQSSIRKMVNLISGGPGDTARSWAESYTYWNYTKVILYPWMNKYEDDSVFRMASQIEKGFAITAYQRGDIYYPAPFGDLWDQPLDSVGQEIAKLGCFVGEPIGVKNIRRVWCSSGEVYIIDPMPMGMNGHCETESHTYIVKFDIPQGFKYYEGYDKKYKDKKAEWKDLLNPIRLLTIPFIW